MEYLCAKKGLMKTKIGFRGNTIILIVYDCIYLSKRDEAGQLGLDPVVTTDARLCKRLFSNKETVSRRITFDTE